MDLRGQQVGIEPFGFIHLEDYMGCDKAIVDAARISYGKHFDESRTPEADETLLRFLMRSGHTSPFEQGEIKFVIKCPMDVWRQWIRHRTANVNEYSTRYTEALSDVATTKPTDWRLQSKANKQGSDEYLNVHQGEYLTRQESVLHQITAHMYNERLSYGIAREQARKDLPLSTYTMAYWKVDVHNLMHFLYLRMDSHAQLEIRKFAIAIFDNFFEPLFPRTAQAFLDYRFNAVTFTALEIKLIMSLRSMLGDMTFSDKMAGEHNLTKREASELREKLKRFRS